MIKRTVEISREPAHVSLKHDQIVLSRGETIVATIPSEDLGILVVDHPQTNYSATVRFEGQNGQLMVVLHRYVNSFLRCLKKTEPKIVFPKMIDG